MEKYKVKLEFTEPLLGTAPLKPGVWGDIIPPKAEAEGHPLSEEEIAEEISTLPEEEPERTITGFHRLEDGTPFLYDYVFG